VNSMWISEGNILCMLLLPPGLQADGSALDLRSLGGTNGTGEGFGR
jgi:hypothetical protein